MHSLSIRLLSLAVLAALILTACSENAPTDRLETAASPNLVKNGDFSAGMSDWEIYKGSGTNVSNSIDDFGRYCVWVGNGGSNGWDVLLFQRGIQLSQGSTYDLTFDVVTSVDKTAKFDVKVSQGSAAPSYTSHQVTGGNAQTKSLSFVAENSSAAQLEFFLGGQAYGQYLCFDNVSLTVREAVAEPEGDGDGLRGTYFNNADFTSKTFERVDGWLHFDWQQYAPREDMGPDTFSARWEGELEPSHNQGSKTYTFYLTGDDGVRLWVNGEKVIDGWKVQAPTEYKADVTLSAGARVPIKVEYYESEGGAFVKLDWQPAGASRATLPKRYMYSAASSVPNKPSEPAEPNDPPPPSGETISIPGKRTVRLNQLGFYPNATKTATIVNGSGSALDWKLVRAAGSSGTVVASGKTAVKGYDAASGDTVHIADFSSVKVKADNYQLVVGDGSSHLFKIADDVYRRLKYDSMMYFYQQRASIPIEAAYVERPDLARPAGHAPDIATCSGSDSCDYSLDVSKGWYDAGDHGKYLSTAGTAVWSLFFTYETLQDKFADGTLLLPENTNGKSDLLDELRWELDFIMNMQVPEGKPRAGMVHHHVHGDYWTAFPTAPADDPSKRLLRDPSTSATLNAARSLAMCARAFRAVDAAYADKCLSVARRAWQAANDNPNVAAPVGLTGGGNYADAGNTDEWFAAAAELYITTGEQTFYDVMKSGRGKDAFMQIPSGNGYLPILYHHVGAGATLSLLMLDNNLPAADLELGRNNVIRMADSYLDIQNGLAYPAVMASGEYIWGSNEQSVRRAMIMAAAFELTGDAKYLRGVSRTMDYLLGQNPLDQAYITGNYGEVPFVEIHHRFWGGPADSAYPFAPSGIIAGGPNEFQKPYGADCKPQRCFADDYNVWTSSEVSVTNQASLTWIAAYLDDQY